MSFAIVVLGVAAAIGVCVWFFVGHTPERAASYERPDG
jgi:hypothetical protein